MKSWILLTIVAVFSLQAKAFTSFSEAPSMLSPNEFASLTQAEQKSYVRKMREIFVEMNENNPHLAAEMAKRSPLFAQILVMNANAAEVAQQHQVSESIEVINRMVVEGELFADDVAKSDISKMSTAEKQRLEAKFEQSVLYLKASYAVRALEKDHNTKQLENAVDNQITPMQDKIEANYQKIKAAMPDSPVLKMWDDSKKQINEKKLDDSLTYMSRIESYADVEKSAKKSKTKNSTAKKEAVSAKGTTEVKVNEPKELSNTNVLYRCMYAGFVIRSGKCVAPSELPWMVDGLNTTEETKGKTTSHIPKEFKCEDGKVMCNPFLFGAEVTCDWKKAVEKDRVDSACLANSKPFCVRPNAYATRDCNSLASKNNETSLDVAVHLMTKSAQNKLAYQDFFESFNELCNRGRIDLSQTRSEAHAKADVKQTCEVAKKRFAEVRKKYDILSDSRKKYDAYLPENKKNSKKTETKTKTEKGAK